VPADQFVELEGENEVCHELDDREIVLLVKSEVVDDPDTDEDETDNRQECTITTRQAVHFADQLEAFALCNSDVISVEHMLTLGRITCELQQKQLFNLRQADIATIFAPM
jgi:hypothetical protein